MFGEGPSDARVLFLGEAPGRNEDETGAPFCGRSGMLLDELLTEANIDRSSVFVTSIVKCRPPNNRDPKGVEIRSCEGWLEAQIDLIRPEIVCTLGNFALQAVRGDRTGITALHGQAESRVFYGHKVLHFPLFHPAAALRSSGTKELLREDLAALSELLAALN